MLRKFSNIYILSMTLSIVGCVTDKKDLAAVHIPFIKNSQNECYFLDDFMPVPDGLVSGKHGALSLRYYTYRKAHYKEWEDRHIILSFYSNNDRCWSLYEEYYVEK